MSQFATKLLELAEEGKTLAVQYDGETQEVSDWVWKCRTAIQSKFGKHSKQDLSFRKGLFPDGKLVALEMIAADELDRTSSQQHRSKQYPAITINHKQEVNVSQSQIQHIHSEIMSLIEKADVAEPTKDELREIYKVVQEELQQPSPNKKRLTDLTKTILDSGMLKLAAEVLGLISKTVS